ncbi:MAG: hypothetical protein ABWY56_09445 [Propionibacteriaceae bacterium]
MDDLLGYQRIEQHTQWRCSGRFHVLDDDVPEDEIDDEPTFVLERQGDRWLLTSGDGRLIAVGDATRDLVATAGGLERRPAPLGGFGTALAANVLRRLGSMDVELIGEYEVQASRASEHANRPALDVDLRSGQYDLTLGVDAETGLWTWMGTAAETITVEQLTVGAAVVPDAAFALLDLVPEVDLSQRMPVAEGFLALRDALQEASGLHVKALWQDEETGVFRLILLDAQGQPQALVLRERGGSPQDPAVFAGAQVWWEGEDWNYHIDTTNPDHSWSRPIEKVLEGL